ncbi:divergent AAA domain protein [Capnocytophaga gingivalis ATCC 33624]|jgi:putative transcriptional regulator|uniref:RNA-binding domain-containing protein n=1 Tax=Capnocytophaga gingivalis TaxID=1017 RepID=UPI00019FB607|nr:RNA-binding domain-containing protein [Capnocytophaga gingivalis]EEK14591.1 divergent AAA domain protein [Capnocytophaga gingivalis ATCC 33624]
MITKEHLQKILSDTESYHIEKTVATDNMDKFSQAICAFSNDVADSKKKGYLLIGVRDNGELAGLQVDDKLLLQISNIRTDGNILPQPVMTVEKFSFAQGDILVVEVTPSQVPPVRYRGRIWVRVGPRKSIATEAEEKLLTERRLSNIRTFDAMPCLGTTLEDLDITLFKKEYLFKAVAEDILQEDKRTIEEQMASLGLYDLRYQCPTNAAIVLFGNNPERFLHGAYIQYVRFKGLDRAGDIINEHKFSGNLCKVLPRIDVFVETSIAQKRPIPISVLREKTVSKYPYWATRELLMNAIMHRDYESNAPVAFYEYDDHIEIQNAGGLYGKVSANNFPNVSDYRNPFIAEAMKVLGYVNRFSRGVYRVQKELEENGNGKASFDFSLITAFRVVEPISTTYFEEGFGEEESDNKLGESTNKTPIKSEELPNKLPNKSGELPNKIEKTPNKSTDKKEGSTNKSTNKSGEIPNKFEQLPNKSEGLPNKSRGTTQERILVAIQAKPEVTQKELAQTIGITLDGIKYHIKNMTKLGIIKHEGSTKSGKWIINNN